MVGEGLLAREVAEEMLEGDAQRLGLDPAAIGLWLGEGVEDARKAAMSRAASGVHRGQTDSGDDGRLADSGVDEVANKGGDGGREEWAAIGHER
jgi:hypothetical protein